MDCLYYIPARLLRLALVAALFAPPAWAGAISNLTQMPQTIEVKTSNGYVSHVIAPGRTWRINGAATIKFSAKEFYLDDNKEYAMWPDGAFGPQRTIYNNHYAR